MIFPGVLSFFQVEWEHCILPLDLFLSERDTATLDDSNLRQGGHVPAEMKFPVFSLCLIHFSLCHFYVKNNS